MKLSSIQALVAVVECGGIHAAARHLAVSHPSISKSVRLLEDELGCPLLLRSSRGASLTPAGTLFYERAKLITSELQRATEDVAQLGDAHGQGSVHVGVSPAASCDLVPRALERFRALFPAARVTLSEGWAEEALEQLRRGVLDLSISPISRTVNGFDFDVSRLLSVEMAVVARRGHRLEHARSLAELADADWVRLGGSRGGMVLLDQYFERHGLPLPASVVDSLSPLSSLMLVRMAGYVALMPRKLVFIGEPAADLVELRLREPPPSNNLALVLPASRALTPLAKAFARNIKLVAAELAADGAGQAWTAQAEKA